MRTPNSTYRVQLSPNFSFQNLVGVLDYLDAFHISTVYSSPIFQARKASTHGYDIVNPHEINREIGDMESLRQLHARMQEKEMGWLQDIVPNHMAVDYDNPWINDVWERGAQSEYYHFFDINWEDRNGGNSVLLPILGEELEEAVKNRKLQLSLNNSGFVLQYFDLKFPVSAQTYSYILFANEGFSDVRWKLKFKNFPSVYNHWIQLKSDFIQHITSDQDLSKELENLVESINASDHDLYNIVDLQYYQPVHWKLTESQINYRRFFTINDLICLRMEDQNVFETYHTFIKSLCQEGFFSGLRIDHIDGLFNPTKYLKELREMVGDDIYLIVEKILEKEEQLPDTWPIEGTTGYDFMALVNNLFISVAHHEAFKNGYDRILAASADCVQQAFEKKQFILHQRMKGELDNLWEMLQGLVSINERSILDENNGKRAFGTFLAAFPVYRIYPDAFPLSPSQAQSIKDAYDLALQLEPELKAELDYLKSLFLGQANLNPSHMEYFIRRTQQLTGPLAAKGIEDTLFYSYNMLLSKNEVGDSPCTFGLNAAGFHERMAQRQEYLPRSLNATSTHDTKRGEDARMRINVLSAIPDEWFRKVDEWHSLNQEVRKGGMIPDRNEEYFIYQTLLGAKPFGGQIEEDFINRTRLYLQKSLREAKTHSFWSAPNESYEQQVMDFAENILNHQPFRDDFDAFSEKIGFYGAMLSLGQSLIKVTAPGIPDIYQGTELWDLSYVDPDNRREVDYDLRKNYLAEMEAYPEEMHREKLKNLMDDYRCGKIKMFTLYRALKERMQQQDLFINGEYIPVRFPEPFNNKVGAYFRKHKSQWYLTVVPLTLGIVEAAPSFPFENPTWDNVVIDVPESVPTEWKNIYTGRPVVIGKNHLDLLDILSSFPVALLKSTS